MNNVLRTGLIWCAWVWGASCLSAPLTIPAELFTDLGKAELEQDFLSFYEQAEVKVAFKVPVPGEYDVVIVARGEEAAGEPARLRLSMDGQKVGEFDASSGPTWKTHTLPITLDEGERLLSVRFINDVVAEHSDEARSAFLYSVTLVQREEVPGLDVVNAKAFKSVEARRLETVLEDADRVIRKIRLGSVVVQVVDEQGVAIDKAQVTFESINPQFTFGTALSSKAFNTAKPLDGHVTYKTMIANYFNEVVPENALMWKRMEPRDGESRTEELDAMVVWAEEQGMSVRGHCLFESCPEQVQRWIKDMEDEVLWVRLEQRIMEVTEKYPNIFEYDVNNEMLNCSYYHERLGAEVRPKMFEMAHQAAPKARLYVNDFDILNGLKSDAFMEHIQDLLAAGAPVDGIGVQAHFSGDVDVATVRQVLDQLAIFDIPIKLTQLDVHAETEEQQAKLFDDVLRIAYGHPAVHGISLWGFWEPAHSKPEAALFRKDFSPKPAGEVMERFVENWRPAFIKDTAVEGLVDDYLTFGTCRVSVACTGYDAEVVEFDHRYNLEGDPKRLTVVLKKK